VPQIDIYRKKSLLPDKKYMIFKLLRKSQWFANENWKAKSNILAAIISENQHLSQPIY